MKVALAQMDLVVGDIASNAARIKELIERAGQAGASIVAFPELAVTGYPPEDLVYKRTFVSANLNAVDDIAAATAETAAVFGFVEPEGEQLFNAAAICHAGRLIASYRKQLLPNYGVFDEGRYFQPGKRHHLFDTPQGILGVCVCEDAWSPTGPLVSQGDAGAQVVININASPFHKEKLEQREEMLCARARRARCAVVYVNMVGGQDELVFDGGSLVISPEGEVLARLPQFEEAFAVVDVPLGESSVQKSAPGVERTDLDLGPGSAPGAPPVATPLEGWAEVYEALKLSLRDYVRKNDFRAVVIGLSGGIDSSLTATIAADALGPAHVLCVTMPSQYSSAGSVSDSEELTTNLGVEFLNLSIKEEYDAFLSGLDEAFGPVDLGLAEENLQARIRGALLMTISNRYGHLVLATGNKSEMAVGYSTLYGDMVGGWALLKDVFKTEVYELARYRNSIGQVIPNAVLTKAPSAELRPEQKDEDSLPLYAVLDPILEAYIEQDASLADIVGAGHDETTAVAVIRLVDAAEYKRRQGAPGPKVTTKAFGRDRRLPITNRWRETPTA
jgi:NAD+ synthase (glutamine-hydrolysing)